MRGRPCTEPGFSFRNALEDIQTRGVRRFSEDEDDDDLLPEPTPDKLSIVLHKIADAVSFPFRKARVVQQCLQEDVTLK